MPRPRLPRICSNIRCKTVDTPLWRKGWNRDDGTNARLCNACGLHWRKGHFCPYSWCFAVYKEHETDGFVGTWLKCKRCSRWSHIACILMAKELKRRTCDKEHPNYQSVLADVRNTVEAALQSNPKLGESLPLPHYCPDCEVVQQPPRQSRQATTTKRANNKITQSPALSSSPSKRKSQNVLLEDDDDDVDDEDEHEEEEAMETDSDPEPIVQSKKKKQSTTINKLSSSPSKHKQSSTQSPSTSSTKFSSVRMRSTRLQKKRKVIYDDNDYDYEHDDDDFIEEASEEKYEYHLRSVTNGKRALGSATPSPSTSPKAHRGSPHSHSSHTSQHTDLSDQPTSDMDESSCISLHGFPASPESKIISNSPHSWTIPIRRQSSRQTQKEVPISSPSKKASSASASFTKQQSSMRFMGSSQAASEPSESVTRVSMTMAFDMQRALDLINQEIIKESSCDVQKRSNTIGSPRTSNNNSNSNTCNNNNNNSVSISNNNNNNNNNIPIPDNMRCLWAVCEIELQNLAAL